jgi:hypothetical protein
MAKMVTVFVTTLLATLPQKAVYQHSQTCLHYVYIRIHIAAARLAAGLGGSAMSPWELELCSEVQPVQLEWLWPGYLPRGKLAILDGDPEIGKSLLAIDLIARLSRGDALPDAQPAPRPCTSILISTEDERADTIRPRAEAAGVVLDRFVTPRQLNDQVPRFPDHIPALEELIRASTADLVVVDPLIAFLPPRVAANVDQQVRKVLSPLAMLAARTGCTILLLRHLTKMRTSRALFRGQGSVGIIAAARMGLFVAPHPELPDDRVLAVSKSNLAARPPALGYRVIKTASGQPAIEWTGPLDLTADGLCRRKVITAVKARDRAIDWLRRELANGPRKSAELHASAAEVGIPEKTLHRAKEQIRVESHRVYHKKEKFGEWYWYDPNAPWPKDAPFKKPEESDMPPVAWERGV